MKWVVTANTNNCKIYQYQRKEGSLTLITEMSHPENKLRDSDITSDKPGNYKTNNSPHHSANGTYTQESDPKEILIDNFAKEIANKLDLSRKANEFDHLILIVPAQMQGHLNKYLDEQTQQHIKYNVQKNVMSFSHKELISYLETHCAFG